MPSQVIWSERAARELGKIDRFVVARILSQVDSLGVDPKRGLGRLVGLPYYRTRAT